MGHTGGVNNESATFVNNFKHTLAIFVFLVGIFHIDEAGENSTRRLYLIPILQCFQLSLSTRDYTLLVATLVEDLVMYQLRPYHIIV